MLQPVLASLLNLQRRQRYALVTKWHDVVHYYDPPVSCGGADLNAFFHPTVFMPFTCILHRK